MKTLYAKDGGEWRTWLERHQVDDEGVWLIFYKKATGKASLSYDEAIDAALCFGWIDSTIRKIDEYKYARKFTPRRPGSIWSKLNIDRVERLTKQGRMTEHGLALFRKRSDDISQAEQFKAKEPRFPPEFVEALRKNRQAWKNFQKFAPSYRRRYLLWITSAKAADTRTSRVEEAVSLIAKNLKSLLK